MKTRDRGRAERGLETVTSSSPTMKTLADTRDIFLAECETRKLGERTILNYRGTLKRLLLWMGEDKPVTTVDFESLTSFRQQLKRGTGESLTARGSIKVLKILRLFCGFCVDRGWLTSNPAKKLEPPKYDGTITRPFGCRSTAKTSTC